MVRSGSRNWRLRLSVLGSVQYITVGEEEIEELKNFRLTIRKNTEGRKLQKF